jgi:hypothetical protein
MPALPTALQDVVSVAALAHNVTSSPLKPNRWLLPAASWLVQIVKCTYLMDLDGCLLLLQAVLA